MYDWVIIGASPEGLRAAQTSINQFSQRRVALISQGWETVWEKVGIDGWESWRQLGALGIDTLFAQGTFQSTATGLSWQTPKRSLTARAYLLTTDSSTYLAQQTVPLIPDGRSPQTWGLWGISPQTLVFAQQLAQQGHRVQCFSRNAHYLPGEDSEMADLLGAYLQALGIQFWGNCTDFVPHFDAASQRYEVSVTVTGTPQTLTLDHLWVPPKPALTKEIGLEVAGLDLSRSHLLVNAHLQTAHPQIFACGGWLKGYFSPAIAQAEAQYLIHYLGGHLAHLLVYHTLPFGIDLDPPWYRVGLTAPQAAQQGETVQTYYGHEPFIPHCLLRGVCKVVVNDQGQLLGAQWFGQQARPGISLLTLAIAEKLTLNVLQSLPIPDPALAHVLHRLSPNP